MPFFSFCSPHWLQTSPRPPTEVLIALPSPASPWLNYTTTPVSAFEPGDQSRKGGFQAEPAGKLCFMLLWGDKTQEAGAKLGAAWHQTHQEGSEQRAPALPSGCSTHGCCCRDGWVDRYGARGQLSCYTMTVLLGVCTA